MKKYLLIIINIIESICNLIANVSLLDIDREFYLYASNSMIKMVSSFYINLLNETIFFTNIEEYSKFANPTWS